MATYTFLNEKNQLADAIQVLFDFYLPLIDKEALQLYLYGQSHPGKHELEDIASASQLFVNRLDLAFAKLEGVGLVRHFENDVFLFCSVLSGQAFLNHLSLSRLLCQRIGKQAYDRLASVYESLPAGTEITRPIDVSSLSAWDESQEREFVLSRPKRKYRFDMKRFLDNASVFPVELRSQENLEMIARLADTHGIHAADMKKIMLRIINPNHPVFDREAFVKALLQFKNTPDALSAVAFLQKWQKGAPVSPADKRLILDLSEHYGLSDDDIKALLQTILSSTNGKLQRDYVLKVAASWIREGKLAQPVSTQKKEVVVKASTQQQRDDVHALLDELED